MARHRPFAALLIVLGLFNAIVLETGGYDPRFLCLTSPKGVYRVFLGEGR